MWQSPHRSAMMEARPSIERKIYVSSTIIGLFFLFFSFLANFGQKRSRAQSSIKQYWWFLTCLVILFAYIAEIATLLYDARNADFGAIEHGISAIVFALTWTSAAVYQHFLATEVLLLSCISTILDVLPFLLRVVFYSSTQKNNVVVGSQVGRSFIFGALILYNIAFRLTVARNHECSEEAAPFLSNNASESGYSSFKNGIGPTDTQRHKTNLDTESDSECGSGDDDSDDEDAITKAAKSSYHHKLRKEGSWTLYLRRFKIFMPYLIPKKNLTVQLCIVLCILSLIAQRIMTVLVPQQLGIITDKLISGTLPYKELSFYLVLILLSGSYGSVLSVVESLAKIPIQQFSYRQLTNAAFNHVMTLSMDFHSDRDTAEVMKTVEQGQALTNLLQTVVLDMSPTVIDMLVAFVMLYVKFNSSVSLCMLCASLAFLTSEIVTSSWNIDNRRIMKKTERKQSRIIHQAVQGWQTVSAFNKFAHEKSRLGSATENRLTAERNWRLRDTLTDGLLEIIPPLTFYLLALLVMHEIYYGRSTPGDFVFLLQYWDTLIWPLKYLSREYRFIMRDLIDAERLLDLLSMEPTVKDKLPSTHLPEVKGHVKFQKVGFSYDQKRSVIENVNIEARPGETIAFVGTTGAGKSTLAKLLMRYYDVTMGSITVDGHDIRDISQSSLRDALGVVPQDPLLFNASIMENLRYANLSASDEEVYEACRGAAIHDKIMTFADGYKTKVGEHGIKLSGGEVQRLAIARVFLKNPSILIFDEATSAVDTETEVAIQQALHRLSHKRTTFVVAHRLSTIVRANQIIVIEAGTVVERGTHHELLKRQGKYAALWNKQFGE